MITERDARQDNGPARDPVRPVNDRVQSGMLPIPSAMCRVLTKHLDHESDDDDNQPIQRKKRPQPRVQSPTDDNEPGANTGEERVWERAVQSGAGHVCFLFSLFPACILNHTFEAWKWSYPYTEGTEQWHCQSCCECLGQFGVSAAHSDG